jgi:hypothetical protein
MDMFQAHSTKVDPVSGIATTTPYITTPLTVVLEEYRSMDKKIVDYHTRNETALDEFEWELRNRLEKGLRGLMDVEALGLVPLREEDKQGPFASREYACSG